MTVRRTLQLGDPLLRRPSSEVSELGTAEISQVAADLADTLADWVARTGYGRGIAAPQIGELRRVVYTSLDEPMVLINPAIIAHSRSTWEPWEACLSFSVEIFCKVRRFKWVDLRFRAPDGGQRTLHAEGPLAHVLQHEIDHLDGVLATDRTTDVATLCMRSEFEIRHRNESPYRR